MGDLVNRLRKGHFPHPPLMKEAADEIERLRTALIKCGKAAGCLLAPEVSTDFLMGVPEEVRAKISVKRTSKQE